MPRPRVWVNEQGKSVHQPTGVSYHSKTRRFYIIGANNRREYSKTWAAARAAYVAMERARLTAEEAAVEFAERSVRMGAILDKLTDVYGQEILSEPIDLATSGNGAPNAEPLTQVDAWAEAHAVPNFKVVRTRGATPHRAGPRLSAVLADWEAGKALDGVSVQHRRETRIRFTKFIKSAKDRHIANLCPADFRAFYDHLQREALKRGNPARWMSQHTQAIKGVIAYARQRHPAPEWPWPDGVTEWTNAFTRRPVRADRRSREPLPVEEFRKLLATCAAWAAVDPDVMPTTTQGERSLRNRARDRKRSGFQIGAALHLACNCALSNIDLTRLCWKNLKLDAKAPYLDHPRQKTEGTIGAIERLVPLLPGTVAALRSWREYEPSHDGFVFRTRVGSRLAPDRLADAFASLRTAAGVDKCWQFKHIRNIAPSVGRRNKRPADERETILGHRCEGTRAFYEGDVDAEYLAPLVELVGAAYFDVVGVIR